MTPPRRQAAPGPRRPLTGLQRAAAWVFLAFGLLVLAWILASPLTAVLGRALGGMP